MNSSLLNFRRIFIIGVAFVALFELGALVKHIPPESILAILAELPISLTISIFLIGLVAASTGVLSDWVLRKIFQDNDADNAPKGRKFWFESWRIANLNNAFGIGDVVMSWLRGRVFNSRSIQDSATIRQHWWQGTFGLGIASLLSFGATLIFWPKAPVADYSFILLVGRLLPFIGVAVTIRNWKSLAFPVTKRRFTQTVGASLVEWLGSTVAFLAFGAVMHLPTPLLELVPLFIAARIIGLITLVPGGYGRFDIFIFFGLQHLGIDSAVAFLWIMFYRLAYTAIPGIIAVIATISSALVNLNTSFRGVPRAIAGSIIQKVDAVLLYLMGIAMILVGALPGTLESITFLQRFSPWTSNFLTQVPNIFLGFMLIMAGRGIASKVKRAYVPTLILLAITFIYVFISRSYITPVILVGALFLATLFIKPRLTREQLVYSWESRLIDGAIYSILFIAYLLIGLANLPVVSAHFHIRSTGLLLLPSFHWWVIGFLTIVAVSLGVLGFIAYLQGKHELLGEALDEERVEKVLAIGDNHYTNLIFLGDKRLFYYQPEEGAEDSVAIQFRLINNKAAVMSDPFGNANDFKAAMSAFITEADRLGYMPIFYEVSEQIAMIAHEFGYNFMKLGEEARVDTVNFKTAGKKFANIRSEINQAAAAGFEYEVLQPPFGPALMNELRTISNEWLNGREEKGYSLGFFDDHYLQRDGIGVLKAPDGHIVAFATLVTSHTENQMTVDLMRFTKESPNGTMDVLFVKTFEYARDAGYQTFNLGMSPLANVGLYQHSFIRERIANLIFQFGSAIYSFEGLRHYKRKFASDWQPYYIAYSNHSNIIFVMIALLLIDNPGVELD